jgi:hypothetical protein
VLYDAVTVHGDVALKLPDCALWPQPLSDEYAYLVPGEPATGEPYEYVTVLP